jgi:hypothetical protein
MSTCRYLFVFYSHLDIEQIDLLGQVSDRIYVLVSEEINDLPLSVVMKLQKLGKSLKWVAMESDDIEVRRMHLSFLLGKLHEKTTADIEFAVMSNDEDYDNIIAHVNRVRRSCMRVSTNSETEGQVAPVANHELVLSDPERTIGAASSILIEVPEALEEPTILQSAEVGVLTAAAKVRERMLRSGNRPAELELLKEYIILSTPNLQPSAADKVIHLMANNRDIEIENREVVYLF